MRLDLQIIIYNMSDLIKDYINNKKDVSNIIKNINIKGMCLHGAVIKELNKPNEDLSGTDFSRCVIGEIGKITNLSGCNLQNCNFNDCQFLGTLWLRNADLRGSRLDRCYMPYAEYQGADLRNIFACGIVFPLGVRNGLNCKFSKSQFEELEKYWEIS